MSSRSIGDQLAVLNQLTEEQMETLFPFFLSFDRNFLVVDTGPSLRKILPALVPGANLAEHFLLERPHISFSFQEFLDEANSMFLLRQIGRRFLLRGQMALHPSQDKFTYLCSPWLVASGSLQALGLELSDFALHDPMPEFTQVLHSNRLAMDDLGRLSAKLQEQRQTLREAKARLEIALEEERAARKQAEGALQAQGSWITNLKGRIQSYLPNAGSSQLFLRDLDESLSTLQSSEQSTFHADAHFKTVDVLNELAHFLRKVAEAKGISISISCRDLDGYVVGDRNLIYRLLLKLAHNAIKFTESGELAITAQRGSGDLVVFKVMDTGRGIAPQTLSRISSALTRPRFSTPTLISGQASLDPSCPSAGAPPSGLGLALVKQLVDLMHGSIEVFSTLGQGSLFTVTLALAPSQVAASSTMNTIHGGKSEQPNFVEASARALAGEIQASQNPSHFITTPSKPSPAKRRSVSLDVQVLLLEPAAGLAEEATNPSQLPKELLEREGFRIDVASNTEDLLAMLEYAQYDVVLLNSCLLGDPQAARMETLSAARKIRHNEPDAENRLPILALADPVDEKMLRQCAEAGIDECLSLPFNILRLQETLGRLTGSQ